MLGDVLHGLATVGSGLGKSGKSLHGCWDRQVTPALLMFLSSSAR
jgi:hypothetical protein